MSRRGALVLLLAALPACSLLPDVDFQRMMWQDKADVWQSSPYFEDGRAMRPVPEDTVPRGVLTGAPAITDGITGQGYVPEVPIPVTLDLVAAGRARFNIYCSPCHGASGSGDSPVAINMSLRRPPPLTSEAARSLADGRIYQVILEGYGLMRSYQEDLITPEERWSVVAYLRALQLSQATSLDALPDRMRDEAREELR